MKLVGIKLHVTGLENINHKRPSVIICNHRSALDFIVNAHAWPGIYRYLAKSELTKVPVFGWIVKKMCVLVDRSSAMSRARSMVSLKQHIEAGWSIFIYPEGSRNTTTEPLTDFYDGAFRIALQSGAPLAVSVIKNMANVTSSTRVVDLWPGTVHVHWCGTIETKVNGSDQLQALRDEARAMMAREL